jgi:hypothetical protein
MKSQSLNLENLVGTARRLQSLALELNELPLAKLAELLGLLQSRLALLPQAEVDALLLGSDLNLLNLPDLDADLLPQLGLLLNALLKSELLLDSDDLVSLRDLLSAKAPQSLNLNLS